jgi:hypothetical protein
MRKSLLVIWQQLQMQMLQSMLLGLARSATQSMDKKDLIGILVAMIVCFAFAGGYYLGTING